MNIAEASAAPRMHHQWLPDELRVEAAFARHNPAARSMGHHVVVADTMGSTQSILVTDQGLFGSSHPRTPGDLTLGY